MQRQNIKSKLEILLAVCMLALFYLPGLSSVEFHPDESQWIATSDVFETYLSADFKSPLWNKSYWTLTQPPVVRYMIGLSRFIGGYRIPDLNSPWEFGRGRPFNERKGAMPSDGLLRWSRLPMAILAILSLSLVFGLLRSISGRFAAYPWLVLVIISPYYLLQLRRAMGESCLLFFTVLGMYALYRALDSAGKGEPASARQVFIWLAVAGVAGGLAGASKLNGLANIGACVLVAFLCAWRLKASGAEKLRLALTGSALAGLAGAILFIGVNPFLWPDPVGRTIAMIQNRTLEMSRQITVDSPDYIGTWAQRFQIFPIRIFEYYAALPLPFIINFGFFLFGLGLVGIVFWQWLRGKDVSAAAPALLIAAFCASIPPLFTTIDWDRYYLFPVFFSTIFIAVALGWIGRKLFDWLAAWIKSASRP
jgi:4-amino-4-deoxy-L-arabinose transferase-like glycosyltransferase